MAKRIRVHWVQRQDLRTVTKAPITGLVGALVRGCVGWMWNLLDWEGLNWNRRINVAMGGVKSTGK